MGLISFIVGEIVESAAESVAEAAILTTAVVTGGAISAVETVVDGAKDMKAAREAGRNKKADTSISQYDLDLFYAKVAMCAYIAHSDRNLSADERNELNRVLSVAKDIYGAKAVQVAKRIIDNPGTSFMMVEPFFSKVKVKDLDSFLIYAEEMAKTDNTVSKDEEVALERIRSYIESRHGKKTVSTSKPTENIVQSNGTKAESIIELTCPKCGGHMHPDSFGYKANCDYCGYEIVLNPGNAPAKELVEAAKTIDAIANENARGIEFFMIRPNDNVQFYINNSYIGNIEDVQMISMNIPKDRTAISMTYGKNYRKRAEVIIPEDGHEYQVYGGRPDSVVYKLYIFPYSLFDDYMNAVYEELTKPKLKKWINRNKGCQLTIYPDHFSFSYAPLFGDRNWVKKVRYSKETLALAKQIQTRMKDWEKLGYLFCIRKNVIKKFNKAYGRTIREDGVFVKTY